MNTPTERLSGSCHCGALTIEIPAPPTEITSCNCSICRRLGTLWAYYPAEQVTVSGHPESTDSYVHGDRTLRLVRCKTCGCVSHWEPLDAKPGTSNDVRVGVNIRNFDPRLIDNTRMRLLDGADTWTSTFREATGAPGVVIASTTPHASPSDVYPSLTYDDARFAIDWLTRAFGFEPRFIVPGNGNRVEHSELSFGNAVLMISSPKAEFDRVSPRHSQGLPQALSLYVADPDAHFAQAMQAGAKLVRPLQDEEYGARGYMIADPEGHLWYFGTYRPGAYW